MINQLDIERFGSFDSFEWRRAIRDRGNNVENFKRLNVLFGRNYSGKTTLSRVFRSMQAGALPWNHDGAAFTVRGGEADVGPRNLTGHNYAIRVYNRDFVAENLSVLTDQRSGSIKTFAIVGSDNNRILEELAQVNAKLGSIDEKSGARYEAAKAAEAAAKARSKAAAERDALDDKLRRHANEKIKKDRQIGQSNYNIDHIKADIAFLKSKGVTELDGDAVAEKLALLKQEALPAIGQLQAFPAQIDSLRVQATLLLSTVVAPTRALDDLLEDSSLQAWVKEGIRHHQDKRETCAFCRQKLPDDLWRILGEHFSRESSALDSALAGCLQSVATEIAVVERFQAPDESLFYASERTAHAAAMALLKEARAAYIGDLREIESALSMRRSSLFRSGNLPSQAYQAELASIATSAMLEVIRISDARSKTLTSDKETARLALRRDNVLGFIGTIDFDLKIARIADLDSGRDKAADAEKALKEAERALEEAARSLEAQLKDERKGAERVNVLLTHFFGHDGLRLEATDEGQGLGVKFQITRGGKSAYHLSEGECSLIAFCYFMAQLDAPESRGKELIVYIDDPISSLDSNHIFFMFSLIETLIARPAKNDDGSNRFRYEQLFISTHNLDFLKYLKKLSNPSLRDGGVQYFIIERHGNGPSRLSLMPDYLKAYVTEFNYLFHQVYKCSRPSVPGESEEHFYSFGNNLRKFLEAFLYFKYPAKIGSQDSLTRIRQFFGDDELAANLANRLDNELSHLEENFDRSVRPIDIPEIRTLAAFVLEKIKLADRHQYEALEASIGA